MPTGYWPEATARPIPNTASPHPGEPPWLHQVAGKFPGTPLGWCLHVVVGNGSPFETFRRATSPNRRFSSGWVAKDGRAEMYAPAEYHSWAQGDGNGTYWSWETEGFPEEPLTDAQIDTLARWHIWSGTADQIATAPGQRGIITHNAGGAAWGGHTCPDPAPNAGPRSKQRAAIIARAQQIRQGDTTMAKLDDDDRAWLTGTLAKAVAAAVHSQQLFRSEYKDAKGATHEYTVANALLDAARRPFPTADAIAAAIKAQFATLPAGTATIGDADITKLAQATATEIATRLVR